MQTASFGGDDNASAASSLNMIVVWDTTKVEQPQQRFDFFLELLWLPQDHLSLVGGMSEHHHHSVGGGPWRRFLQFVLFREPFPSQIVGDVPAELGFFELHAQFV